MHLQNFTDFLTILRVSMQKLWYIVCSRSLMKLWGGIFVGFV